MGEKDDIRNARLGVFVLVGVILVLVAIFFIGGQSNSFTQTVTVHTKFKDVGGLRQGNNVWLNGVKVGTVSRVEIITPELVKVSMEIREDNQEFIKKDASAYIGSEGLVGNALVFIIPGTAAQAIEDGDSIGSTTVASMQDIMEVVKTSGDNLQVITDNLANLTQRIQQGEGALGYLLTNNELPQVMHQAVTNLKVTSSNAEKLSRDLSTMVNAMQNNEKGMVQTLIRDTTFAGVYSNTLANLQTTGTNLTQASNQINQLTTKMQEGDNIIHVLTEDEEFAGNMQRTVRNAAEGLEKFDENMEALQHNFLFRGFFRRQRREREKQEKEDERHSSLLEEKSLILSGEPK